MRYTKSFIICDRCGKEFEEETAKSPITMWLNFQSFNGKRKFNSGKTDYHLCVDCECKFVEWFCVNEEKKE